MYDRPYDPRNTNARIERRAGALERIPPTETCMQIYSRSFIHSHSRLLCMRNASTRDGNLVARTRGSCFFSLSFCLQMAGKQQTARLGVHPSLTGIKCR